MGVDVTALADSLDGFANLAAVLDDGFVLGQVAQGDFMAQGDLVAHGYFSRGFAFEGQGAYHGPFLQINDSDADVVITLMEQNTMFHISPNQY
jgi:hypothetical protein